MHSLSYKDYFELVFIAIIWVNVDRKHELGQEAEPFQANNNIPIFEILEAVKKILFSRNFCSSNR